MAPTVTQPELEDLQARFPEDPVTPTAWDKWKDREQRKFESESNDALRDIDAYYKKKAAAHKAQLKKSLDKAFERWSNPSSSPHGASRPDPATAAKQLVSKNGGDRVASESEFAAAILKAETAESLTSEAQRRIAGLQDDVQKRDNEIAVLHAQTKQSGTRLLPTALVLALGVVVGSGGAFVGLRSPASPTAADEAARAEIARLNSRISDLAKDNDALTTQRGIQAAASAKDQDRIKDLTASIGDFKNKLSGVESERDNIKRNAATALDSLQKSLETQRVERDEWKATKEKYDNQIAQLTSLAADVQKKLDAAVEKLTRPEMPRNVPAGPKTEDSPPPEISRSIDVCTRLAGGWFDRDNSSGRGQTAIEIRNGDLIQSAIGACTSAARATTDLKLRRRMLAQLGRSYAAMAVKLKVQDQDEAGARRNMSTALATLEQARTLGSAYATSLVAAYYDGKLGSEAGKGFFTERNARKAAELNLEAANADNATAMANYAAALLDKDSGLRFDESQIRGWLEKSENLKYPQAFTLHANAMLDDRFERERFKHGKSTENRRRAAAEIVDKLSCFDRNAAEAYYHSKNGRIVEPYRSPAPKC